MDRSDFHKMVLRKEKLPSTLNLDELQEFLLEMRNAYSSNLSFAKNLAELIINSEYIQYKEFPSKSTCVVDTTYFHNIAKHYRGFPVGNKDELVMFLNNMAKAYSNDISFVKNLCSIIYADSKQKNVYLVDAGSFISRFDFWVNLRKHGVPVFMTEFARNEVKGLSYMAYENIVEADNYLKKHRIMILPKSKVSAIPIDFIAKYLPNSKPYRVMQTIDAIYGLNNTFGNDWNILVNIANYSDFRFLEQIIVGIPAHFYHVKISRRSYMETE